MIRTVDPTDTLAVLKAAREWLGDPEHWTQGSFWKDAAGACTADIERMSRTCATGALDLVVGQSPNARMLREPLDALNAAAAPLSITAVNDGADGHARALAAYDKAIATLESERA